MRGWRYFTEAEAQALLGKHVRLTRTWCGVPKDTTGRVTHATPSISDKGWFVVVQWDLLQYIKPLIDRFSKDEYERCIQEIGEDE